MTMMKRSYDAYKREIDAMLTGDFETNLFDLLEWLSESSLSNFDSLRQMVIQFVFERKFNEEKGNPPAPAEMFITKFFKDLEKIHGQTCLFNSWKALELCRNLEKKIREFDLWRDTDKTEYRFFSEPLDEALYRMKYKPTKQLVQIGVPFPIFYYFYGKSLNDSGLYEQAQEKLQEGLRWNPVDFPLTFEYITALEREGKMDKVRELLDQAFQLAGYPFFRAQCYQKLGYCYEKKRLRRPAYVCYTAAGIDAPETPLCFDYDRMTLSGRAPKSVMTRQGLSKCIEEFHIPSPQNEFIIDSAGEGFKEAMDEGRLRKARYFLEIIYTLTHDEDVLENIIRFDMNFGSEIDWERQNPEIFPGELHRKEPDSLFRNLLQKFEERPDE